MSWISPRSVLGRALLALGIALFAGGLVGSLIGVKTSVTMEGSQLLQPGTAVTISAYTITSKGTVRVEVWNATRVYYVSDIYGDPRSLVKGLQTFNITVAQEQFRTDLRLGLVYGTSTVKAGRNLLQALPIIARTLQFNIVDVQPVEPGHYVVVENMSVNEAFILFALGENVTYKFTYTIGEKNTLTPGRVSLIGALLSVAGLAIIWPNLGKTTRTPAPPDKHESRQQSDRHNTSH